MRPHPHGDEPHADGYSHCLGHKTSGSSPTLIPADAPESPSISTSMVESSVHTQSGALGESPCSRATVCASRTLEQGSTPFMPPRLVG
eukprot:scaffold35107_cov28-Tisochrysis_lutea.AAC.8